MKNVLLCLFILGFHITSWADTQKLKITPYPQSVKVTSDSFIINQHTNIVYHTKAKSSAIVLSTYIESTFGTALALAVNNAPATNYIAFDFKQEIDNEAYQLSISNSSIRISASTEAGWFYALQSLKQLLFVDPENKHSLPVTLAGVDISDSPRFEWRAFMLDEGRHFHGEKTVKMLLDEMARLKMNVFHWHLVDDQGWRIEIKKYPLLTEVGSKRMSTQIGAKHWESDIQSGEIHQGYYTQAQIKDIVRYASERHITVVPEIEMPGHSSAAIAAYNWLGTNKKAMTVPIRFGVGKDVYDVANQKVFNFLTDVLDEVMALFPSKVIHIGGDEVKYDHWKNSPSVRQYMKENGLTSPAELQVHFTNRISQYITGKGRHMMGWNEILGHNLHDYQDEADTKSSQTLAKGSVVHFWKGDIALATQAAKDGFDIVNSLHTETYLDYDFDAIPLSRSYNFDPIPEGLAKKYHPRIIGSGAQMWTEWVSTPGEIHYRVFPRIAAYAEVYWTEPSKKDFTGFKQSLEQLKSIWKSKGIYYAENSESE